MRRVTSSHQYVTPDDVDKQRVGDLQLDLLFDLGGHFLCAPNWSILTHSLSRANALWGISIKHRKFAPRKDKRGIDLISDALPFGRLWRAERNEQRNRLRKILQPLTSCRDPRL